MKKVLSFSLWGNIQAYTVGAIKNAEIAKYMYPDFECWFYIHEETVPYDIIKQLSSMTNTKIIFKNGNLNTCKPMMWRFEPIDDENVEIMLSRDIDTRFLLREKLAVYDWLKSDKLFHIMRDHPHHNFKILGGMFGTKKIPLIQSWKLIMEDLIQKSNKQYDQDFLKEHIYPIIKDNSMIHATFCKYESHCIPFPIHYDNSYQFVGEYVYENESRSEEHIIIIKNEYSKLNNNHKKINLITSFYIIHKNDEKSIQRNNELLECLYKNLHNEDIHKIYLFVDDILSLNKVLEINFQNKINIIQVGKQPLYSDLFEYCIDNLQDKICMISNSDIYLYKFDKILLDYLNTSIFALSRHENDLKCHVLGFGSHDAFIFLSNILNKNILENMNHIQNLAGSDDNIINILVDNGYKLFNPCFEIIIIHLHNSLVRTYNEKKIANGKYFIKQDYLLKNNKDDDFIFYHGLDIIGYDITRFNNINIDKLKEYCIQNNYQAFNTLGYIKNNSEINNLIETEWINKNTNHGIFIKNKK